MTIHILGAGAIAGMAGAYMAMNGEDVTFVDQWREHVEAIRDRGLVIDGIRGRHEVALRALTPDELDEPVSLVFIGVKSQHTEAAMRSIMPHLTEEATVVSLQNGFNAELIAGLIGRDRVIGTVPDYTAALVDPGQLEFTVEGPLYLGELNGTGTPRVREIHRLLSFVAPAKITPNITGRIWTKQCYMSQIVMTAMVDAPISQILESDRNKLLGVALVREAIAVADAAGVVLESDDYFKPDLIRQRTPEARRKQVEILGGLGVKFRRKADEETDHPAYKLVKQGSGMWWDIVYRKRPSETRWITGGVLDRAQKLGVAAPLNQAMVEMVYAIEGGTRPLGWQNLDEVAKLAERHGEPLSVDE
jgi:2-dehydropantoate 2-reductase